MGVVFGFFLKYNCRKLFCFCWLIWVGSFLLKMFWERWDCLKYFYMSSCLLKVGSRSPSIYYRIFWRILEARYIGYNTSIYSGIQVFIVSSRGASKLATWQERVSSLNSGTTSNIPSMFCQASPKVCPSQPMAELKTFRWSYISLTKSCIRNKNQLVFSYQVPKHTIPRNLIWNLNITPFGEGQHTSSKSSFLASMLVFGGVTFCNPSLPNTLWVDVWTPKHLLRKPLRVPNTYSQGIWRILED